MINKKKHIGIILILLIAGFLRFYNLMHDTPYFFNPDERNMAGAITQFQLPSKLTEIPNCLYFEFFSSSKPTINCSLNPHFFAYGQFPLYLAYVSDQIQQSLSPHQQITNNELRITNFTSAIYWLRFWSALASTFTVFMMYLIIKELKIGYSKLAAILTAFIPGLIQSAHFGTTESFLTFFFLLTLYCSLRMTKWLSLASLSVGLAIGSKFTGVFFLVPPCLAIGFNFLIQRKRTIKDIFFQAFTHLRIYAFFFIMTAFFAIISSPYNLAQPGNFFSAVFGYERDVAMGKYEAFYTRQFVHTTPLLFQFEKIFPYSLGIVLTVLGSIGSLILIFILFKSLMSSLRRQGSIMRNLTQRWIPTESRMIIIIVSFLVYFTPNAFLFAKWSRFMTPILPFFVIFSVFLFNEINQRLNNFKLLFNILLCALFIAHCAFGLAFFTIYTRPDSRFTASRWIYKNIPSNSYVLSETANVVDIPIPPPSPAEAGAKEGNQQLTSYNLSPISFDFYHLDESPQLQGQLISYLEKADYIFIPSRRIFANCTREPGKYPILNRYYTTLFNGSLGFEKVAEISSFPSLSFPFTTYHSLFTLSFPDEQSEETFTVFDHPVIRIFKKNQSKTANEYQRLVM